MKPTQSRRGSFLRPRSGAIGAGALGLALIGACSADRGGDPAKSSAEAEGVDTSGSVVMRNPRVDVAHAESSQPLREVVQKEDADEARREDENMHPVGKIRRLAELPLSFGVDSVLQSAIPFASMPAVEVNFLSQGNTNDPTTEGGTPPDTNGAVGPNHFIQAVNTGIAIWDKAGHVVLASKDFSSLWAGYVGTNTGNSCAANNDGDPVIVYDQLADRWFITQFALPNANSGPNFQCVAVSKTGDPTGAYWLYDFTYPGLNDYGKFGIWPDAYYATFNMFNSNGGDSDFCAYDRVSMLSGKTATQHCFQMGNNVSGALPVSLDGKIPPPRGEPGYFMQLSNGSSLDLFKFHVDWVTPANSTMTGPTNIKVAAYTPMCGNNGTCVPQKSPGNAVDALSDRLMFRLTYRNFGTHEALMVNHSVNVTGQGGGVRWYEFRNPNGTPTVYQQGTYAPNDGSWRWMASLAQDQSEAMVLGFSISSKTTFPSIGWTGRLASDTLGVMAQGESVIDTGSGVETGTFSDGTTATRWGDYSNITLDPTDDCTFWYTQELYHVTGTSPRTWDTEVASVKFPSCAKNDFSLGLTPASRTVAPGASVTYTLTTPGTKGSAETIVLAIQDLPSGVTGAFAPTTAPAGTTVTLTLTATGAAPVTTAPVTFTVIGKAPSAVHAATAAVSVGTGSPTVDAGTDSGSGTDSGTILTDSGSGGDDGGADATTGDDSGSTGDDSGTTGDDGATITPPPDAAIPAQDSGATGDDSGSTTGGSDAAAATDGGTSGGPGSSGGCGCRTAGAQDSAPWQLSGVAGLALIGAVRRRRRAR